jgi:hypothetical protein
VIKWPVEHAVPKHSLKGRALTEKAEAEEDILREAPVRPRYGRRTLVAATIGVLMLWWSFHGAKIQPGELRFSQPWVACCRRISPRSWRQEIISFPKS